MELLTDLNFAKFICLLSLGFSLAVLGIALLLRLRHAYFDYRSRRLNAIWKPIFFEIASGGHPRRLPRLHRKDYFWFLKMWVHYQESLRGKTKHFLNEILDLLDVEKTLLKWLRGRFIRKKMMAIVALGHLRAASAWDGMCALVESQNVLVSLYAVRGLLQIDPGRALKYLQPFFRLRQDWPLSLIEGVLKDVPPEVIDHEFIQTIEQSALQGDPRLIKFLFSCSYEKSAACIKRLLKNSQEPEVLSALLQCMNDPRDSVLVRPLTRNAHWIVRLQAVKALGRIGSREDFLPLKNRLSDTKWWVRYRAAQALLALPAVDRAEIITIMDNQPESPAAAILKHAFAEQELVRG